MTSFRAGLEKLPTSMKDELDIASRRFENAVFDRELTRRAPEVDKVNRIQYGCALRWLSSAEMHALRGFVRGGIRSLPEPAPLRSINTWLLSF